MPAAFYASLPSVSGSAAAGHWLIESIGRRDYPALQGGVMLISAVVIGVNLMVDLLYGVIDPRIRHGR